MPVRCLIVVLSFILLMFTACETDAQRFYRLATRELDPETETGNYAWAMRRLDAAVALDPDNREYRLRRAGERTYFGNLRGALEDYEAVCPRPVLVDNYVCNFKVGKLLGQSGDFEGARSLCASAIRVEPTNYQYYNCYALALLALGRHDEALGNAEVGDHKYTKGIILTKLGRREDAIHWFSQTTYATEVLDGGRTRGITYDGEEEYLKAREMGATELQLEIGR